MTPEQFRLALDLDRTAAIDDLASDFDKVEQRLAVLAERIELSNAEDE